MASHSGMPLEETGPLLGCSVSCGLAPLVLPPLKYQYKITAKFTLLATIIYLGRLCAEMKVTVLNSYIDFYFMCLSDVTVNLHHNGSRIVFACYTRQH